MKYIYDIYVLEMVKVKKERNVIKYLCMLFLIWILIARIFYLYFYKFFFYFGEFYI